MNSYNKGSELSQEIGEASKWDIESRRDFAISVQNHGDVSRKMGQLEWAEESYNNCLEIDNDIYEETQTAQALRDLSFDYLGLGVIYTEQGKFEEAANCFNICRQQRESLYEATNSQQSKNDLIVLYMTIRDFNTAAGQPEKAARFEQLANDLM